MQDYTYVQILGYKSSEFIPGVLTLNLEEAPNAESAIRMVITDRADIYVGNLTDILEGLTAIGDEIDKAGYEIVDVNEILLYPVFTKNNKGKIFSKYWDEGIRELSRRGRVKEIYGNYGLGIECPDYSKINTNKTE